MENTKELSNATRTSKWQSPSIMIRRGVEEGLAATSNVLLHVSIDGESASTPKSIESPSLSSDLCNGYSPDPHKRVASQDTQFSLDTPTCTRVQLSFRGENKQLRLNTGDTSLSSLRNLEKLSKRCFPEIEGLLERGSWKKTVSKSRLVVSYKDSEGGSYIAVKSDSELDAIVVKGKLRRDYDKSLAFIVDVKTPEMSSDGVSEMSLSEQPSPVQSHLNHPNRLPSQPTVQCRYFQSPRGCKNGPTCRFSHELPQSPPLDQSWPQSPGLIWHHQMENKEGGASKCESNAPLVYDSLLSSGQINDWLLGQIRLSAAENIEELGSGEGWCLLSKVVEQRELSSETIILLLTLVVKDDIRSSEMRRETNKIYRVFLGSRFLPQLQAFITTLHGQVASHSAVAVIRRSLFLIEELMWRTYDGWKEVPLDAVTSVILQMDSDLSSGRDKLLTKVTSLLNQRTEIVNSKRLGTNGFNICT